MPDYIDRDALLLHIKDLPTWWADAGGVYGRSMKYPNGMFDCEDVVSSIENAPSALIGNKNVCGGAALYAKGNSGSRRLRRVAMYDMGCY